MPSFPSPLTWSVPEKISEYEPIGFCIGSHSPRLVRDFSSPHLTSRCDIVRVFLISYSCYYGYLGSFSVSCSSLLGHSLLTFCCFTDSFCFVACWSQRLIPLICMSVPVASHTAFTWAPPLMRDISLKIIFFQIH